MAIWGPFITSGYLELNKAKTSSSYVEMADHYRRAAQRIPWRPDLYELSGHAFYHAKEYAQADLAYQQTFSHQALSPQGWVAWGDVNYLNDHRQRAMQIWEQAIEQRDPSDQLYSR